MTDEDRLRWAEDIKNTRARLDAGQAGTQEVVELVSKIIAQARESIGDTQWMEYIIHGVVVGLSHKRNVTYLDEKTLAGLDIALSSAHMALVPIENLSPDCRKPSSNIKAKMDDGRSFGLTDARFGMS